MPVFVDTPVAASTIITRAMRLMGQIGQGISPTTAEYAIGLSTLNGMMDSFRNERLMCAAIRDESLSLVVGDASYTIGPSGDLNTDRPVRIDGAYVVDSGGTSHGVTIITDIQYASIPLKTNPGPWPDRLYYQPTIPQGILNIYPVPEVVSTLHVLTWIPVQSFAALATTMTLAPGWFDCLSYNLAVNWAPEFEREVLPAVSKKAVETKAGIKRTNNLGVVASFDPALIGDSGWYDWRTGGP